MDLSNLNFEPHTSFTALFAQPDVQDIWKLLKQPDNLIRYETAAYLSKAPVESITPQLLSLPTFSESTDLKRQDRVKQLIGAMVRCIMEELGYEINPTRLKLRVGTPSRPQLFKTASSYSKSLT